MLLLSPSRKSFPASVSFIAIFLLIVSLFQASVLGAPTSEAFELQPRAVTRADAKNDATILKWLLANSKADRSKIVFYSNTPTGLDQTMAFCKKNPGYTYWEVVFGPEWKKAFNIGTLKQSDPDFPAIGKATSVALANFATGQVRVFQHKNSKPGSIWLKDELPILRTSRAVTNIWNMADGTTKANDFQNPKDLKIRANLR